MIQIFSKRICFFWVWFGLVWFQKVQKALLQSDVQSKSDKSPVTVADYGLFVFFSLSFNLYCDCNVIISQ